MAWQLSRDEFDERDGMNGMIKVEIARHLYSTVWAWLYESDAAKGLYYEDRPRFWFSDEDTAVMFKLRFG